MATYAYGALSVRVTGDTSQLASDIKSGATKAGTEAAGGTAGAFNSGLKAVGGLAASVGKSVASGLTVATGAATAFGVEAFKTAARAGEMDASLRALAKANNVSYDSMSKAVTAIRGQGIEMGTAQNLVAVFTRNQLDLAKSTDLARVAQDAAVISGRNSTEVLADITHGIETQNSQVLRNAGLNTQAGTAISAYAKQLGIAQKDMTSAQRAQAVLNAVLDEGKTVAGAYEAAMKEPGKVLRSFSRVVDDIKLSVGQGLLQAFGPLILQAYDLAKALSTAVAPGGALAPIFDAIGVAVTKLVAPLAGLVKMWTDWIKGLKPEQVERMASTIKTFGPAFIAAAAGLSLFVGGNLLGQIPILGGLLTNLTGPLKLVTGGIAKLAGGAIAAIPGIGSMGSAAGLLGPALAGPQAAIVGVVAAIAAMMIASKDFREGVIAMGQALWTGLKPALSSVWELVKTFGLALWEIIKAIGDALGPALKNLAPLLEQIGKLFGANLAGGADGAGSSMSAIVPVITGLIRAIGFLLDITTKVLVPIIEVPLKLMVWASTMLQVVNPIKLVGQAVEWLIGIVQKLWHWITGNSPGLIPAFQLLGGVAGQVAGAMAGVVAAKFGQMVSVVADATRQIGTTVSASWSSLASGARTAGASMVDGLKAGLSGAKNLGGWIGSNVTGPVVGFIKKGLGTNSPSTITITIGADVIEGLKRGLDKARELGGWVQGNVVAPILGTLKSAFGIGSPSKVTKGYGQDISEGLRQGLGMLAKGGSFSADLGGLNVSGSFGAQGATINVYPREQQSELDIAAQVSRALAWATAGGIA